MRIWGVIYSLEQERISLMSCKPTLVIFLMRPQEKRKRTTGDVWGWFHDLKKIKYMATVPLIFDHLPYLPFHNHSKPSCGSFKMLSFINQDLTAVVNVGIYYESFYLVLSHFDSDSKTTTSYQLCCRKRKRHLKAKHCRCYLHKKKKKTLLWRIVWSPAKYPEKACWLQLTIYKWCCWIVDGVKVCKQSTQRAWEHYVNNPIKRCTCTHILNFFNKSSMGF